MRTDSPIGFSIWHHEGGVWARLTIMQGEHRRMTCALFVDFDNVYSSLNAVDAASARAFVEDSAGWLAQLAAGSDEDGPFTRRFLQKSLYLNPAPFGAHRATLTRGGFRVVDCPSLTKAGKSSADMWMAVDIIDAIAHPARYGEFIIISSDADFTPLVHRIRAHDRRVTVITVGFAAAAYRANADQVVDSSQFTRMLGTDAEPLEATPMPTELVLPLGIEPSLGVTSEPSLVAVDAPDAESPEVPNGDAKEDERTTADSELVSELTPAQSTLGLRAAQAIADLVIAASGPVPASTAAAAAKKVDPSLPSTKWDGLGFMGWVESRLQGVGTQNSPGPGFIWDASRFDAPGGYAPLSALQLQVASVTEIPRLTEDQYCSLHSALSEAISATGLTVTKTPGEVKDLLANTYPPVSLRAITQVVRSLLLYSRDEPLTSTSPSGVAERWSDLVIGLAEGSRVDLTDADRLLLRRWLGGGLAP